MKLFLVSFFLFLSIVLFSSDTYSPDWLVFIGLDGTIEVFDDGCRSNTLLWESGGQWNGGGLY